MAKFTHNGKTYNTNDRKKGMSEREYVASITGGSKSAPSSSKAKAKKSGSDSSGTANTSNLGDLVKQATQEVLGATPGFNKPVQDFEQIYTPELQNEDIAQSKALFEPFYNNQISSLLEDLSSTEQMESMSYDRTLRRVRFSMAAGGGAIGSEREMADKEITDRQQYEKTGRMKSAERTVGTERLQGAGFKSVTGSPVEGSLIGEMKANIADQTLWNKNQRMNRYYGDAQNYYQQSPATNLLGKKF